MSYEEVVRETEYLRFVEIGDTGKTKIWVVASKSGGYPLAHISWYGPWRQYVLRPERDTLFNTGCLNDIVTFINDQMAARRSRADHT